MHKQIDLFVQAVQLVVGELAHKRYVLGDAQLAHLRLQGGALLALPHQQPAPARRQLWAQPGQRLGQDVVALVALQPADAQQHQIGRVKAEARAHRRPQIVTRPGQALVHVDRAGDHHHARRVDAQVERQVAARAGIGGDCAVGAARAVGVECAEGRIC